MKFIFMNSLLIITSCNFKEKHLEEDSFTIDGKWILNNVSDSVFDITDLTHGEPEFQPYLIFDTKQNKIGGYSGCNTFITNATFEESKIQVNNNIAATERGCYKNWEGDFFGFVENINNYKINYDTLYLNTENNKRLIFLKADKFGINGNWKLTKIDGKPFKQNSKLFDNLKTPTIVIDTDKDLIYGSTGFATFQNMTAFTMTSWQKRNDKPTTTVKTKGEIDSKIHKALLHVEDYDLNNDVLDIKSKDKVRLQFSRIF